jgi:hypothetical protein
MKTIIIIFSALVLSSCAKYPFEGWTKGDTIRQVANAGLSGIDWMQTNEIASNQEFREFNPVLGENPSTSTINVFFPVTILADALIAGCLAPGKPRQTWQYINMGARAVIVINNHRIGVRP